MRLIPSSGFRAVHAGEEVDIHAAELDLEPAISAHHRARPNTSPAPTGAAIALRAGDEIVCRARAGRTAARPRSSLANRLPASPPRPCAPEKSCCATTPSATRRVDLASCRRLGVRSILVSPLRLLSPHFWVCFEVLSSSPSCLRRERRSPPCKLLSSMMVAAISRISSLHQAQIFATFGIESCPPNLCPVRDSLAAACPSHFSSCYFFRNLGLICTQHDFDPGSPMSAIAQVVSTCFP